MWILASSRAVLVQNRWKLVDRSADPPFGLRHGGLNFDLPESFWQEIKTLSPAPEQWLYNNDPIPQ